MAWGGCMQAIAHGVGSYENQACIACRTPAPISARKENSFYLYIRSPNDLGGVTPKCLKAANVAMRPRGVRCK